MHRFYLPPDQCRGETILLADREAHHGLNVLRLKAGESVAVLNGVGDEFHCQIAEVSRRTARLVVRDKRTAPTRPFAITLLQGIPKGKTFDSIIQKATELGVRRIVPLATERSEVHLDATRAEAKVDKWQSVAIEAIKQCGSPWLPQIESPMAPGDFLKRQERFDLELVAALHPDSRHPHDQFPRELPGSRPFTCAIWVGPEGDFAPPELTEIRAAGARPITLGPLVLRCDTAAIYCLSVINYELSALAGRC